MSPNDLSALGGIRTPNLLIRSRATDVCLMRSSDVIPGHGGAFVWDVRSCMAIYGPVDGQADGQLRGDRALSQRSGDSPLRGATVVPCPRSDADCRSTVRHRRHL